MSLCLIGKVVAAHGIRGGVKVRSYTDHAGRFALLDSVLVGTDEGDAVERRVTRVQELRRDVVLFFADIVDRNEAERVIGQHVFIRDHQMLPPPDGKRYVHDLIGCTVESPDGVRRGTIEDVLLLPANPVYVVRGSSGETLVPAVDAFILETDVARKRVIVADVPGLFEDLDED